MNALLELLDQRGSFPFEVRFERNGQVHTLQSVKNRKAWIFTTPGNKRPVELHPGVMPPQVLGHVLVQWGDIDDSVSLHQALANYFFMLRQPLTALRSYHRLVQLGAPDEMLKQALDQEVLEWWQSLRETNAKWPDDAVPLIDAFRGLDAAHAELPEGVQASWPLWFQQFMTQSYLPVKLPGVTKEFHFQEATLPVDWKVQFGEALPERGMLHCRKNADLLVSSTVPILAGRFLFQFAELSGEFTLQLGGLKLHCEYPAGKPPALSVWNEAVLEKVDVVWDPTTWHMLFIENHAEGSCIMLDNQRLFESRTGKAGQLELRLQESGKEDIVLDDVYLWTEK